MTKHKYKAFISYSHQDDRWARWLHKRLENYRLPKSIIGKETPNGIVPRRLKPIFRDREELAAADDLGEKIELALTQSENLIIICSPEAVKSHWVNEEILFFKRQNRNARIFSIIVSGEPYASNIAGQSANEAFPPALRFQLNPQGELSSIPAEPLAADLRDHADGKRLGVLKLISGLIGVGLDEIVQRDMQRNRRRVMAVTSTALATVLVMGTLTGFALNARQEAEHQRGIAQARTASAEELIEFMVTDLKVKLNAVGRLDALQVVGEKASSYYDQYPLSSHDDDALGRRARVFHFLGEIEANTGDHKTANDYFQRAYQSSKVLLERSPNDANRIFDHAQSAFWLTHIPHIKKDYDTAEIYYEEYARLADRLLKQEPDRLRSVLEKVYANGNLATAAHLKGHNDAAYKLYIADVNYMKKAIERYPDNIDLKMNLADSYAWLGDISAQTVSIEEAIDYRQSQYDIFNQLQQEHPKNIQFQYHKLTAASTLTGLYFNKKELSDAKILLNTSLFDSENLWAGDQQNTQWLETYVHFILHRLLFANYENNTKLMHETIALYERVKSTADTDNEVIASIFKVSEQVYNQRSKKYVPHNIHQFIQSK